MSVIYGHPVTATTRAFRFANHMTKRKDALGTIMPLSPPGLVSEHEQICGQKLGMRDRKSVIYRHPVMAATRDLCFPDHVQKETESLGQE